MKLEFNEQSPSAALLLLNSISPSALGARKLLTFPSGHHTDSLSSHGWIAKFLVS
jgi:hypothetical protein